MAIWRHGDSKDLLSNIIDMTSISVVGGVIIVIITGAAATIVNLARKTEDEPLHGVGFRQERSGVGQREGTKLWLTRVMTGILG